MFVKILSVKEQREDSHEPVAVPLVAKIRFLSEVFGLFDRAVTAHSIERVKTIGSAYLAVAGMYNARPDHASAALDWAIQARNSINGCAQRVAYCRREVALMRYTRTDTSSLHCSTA